MRLVKHQLMDKLPEDKTHLFFIQLWYSKVHQHSLDSHRVKCMDSLNILRELQNLLKKQHLPKIEEDVDKVAQETLEILKQDTVVSVSFGAYCSQIVPILQKIIKNKKEAKQYYKLLSYLLRDFLQELNADYKKCIFENLKKATFVDKSELEIQKNIGLLLTRLIDEGYSLEDLFNFVTGIFINNKSPKGDTFEKNFDFMGGVIHRIPSVHEIIIRLEGGKKHGYLPPEISSIKFCRDLPLDISTLSIDVKRKKEIESILTPSTNVIFAWTKITSRGDRSAGLDARNQVEDVLDLFRFELERELVSISPKFVSIRSDRSARAFLFPSHIPNPTQNLDEDQFITFIDEIGAILAKKDIDRELKERIKSALRFYRMGRDSHKFENKFLNWWTGLEYLTRRGSGGIIGSVEKVLVTVLKLDYVAKHLEDAKETLIFCKAKLSHDYGLGISSIDFGEMGLEDFLVLLRNEDAWNDIQPQLEKYPAVELEINYLRDQIKDAETINKFLTRHTRRLSWHIHRIYRTRCDIVHSAEYALNLTLLCANLEYYLKFLLSYILGFLTKYPTIESLDELYTRFDFILENMDNELKSGKEEVLRNLLRERKV